MKHISKVILVLLCILLSYPFYGMAQNIKSFDFKGNFFYNTITSIEQDTLGFMWLGLDNGVFLFDGYSLQPLIHSMISDRYVNFLSHRKTTLYIGTNEGLYAYNYINNQCDLCSPLLKSKNIIAYQCNSDYQVVATDREVFLFDYNWNFIHKITIYKESLNNHITSMVIYGNQEALLGTESGLVIIHIENDGKTKSNTLYSGDKIVQLFIDSRNKLWICRGEEILYSNIDTLDSVGISGFKHIAYNHEVISFFEYANQVWVGTRGYGISIYEYDHSGKAVLKNKLLIDKSGDSELKNTINKIYKDKKSRIWICTLEGVYLYNDESSNFHAIKHSKNGKNVPSSNIISSIYCDNDYLWLATSNGINKIKWNNKNDYTITQYVDRRNTNDIMAGNKIQCITKFKDQTFLISTKNAIKFFDSGRCLFYDDQSLNVALEQYGMRYVRSIFKDYYNNIWLAFSEGGVGSINASTGKFTRLDYPEKVKGKHRAICRDSNGNIWLSSDNDGLYRLQLDDDLKVISTKLYPRNMFGGSWITAIYIDHQKRIWAGTANGLYRYNIEQDKFTRLEFPYSRKSSYIGAIIQDNMENIWAVSLHGIYKINLEDLIVYYELNVNQDIVKTWYILGTCVNRNGEIFIGGVNGLNFFNPTQLTPDTYPHNVYISGIKLLNKENFSDEKKNRLHEINNSGKLVLSYKDTQFSLSFSSLYYKDPLKIEYAYMLEDFDKDWIITDASRNNASYSNLTPGTYTFKIKSTNASGIWMDNIRTIEIVVEKAPWRTWWAYSLYVSIVAGILLLVVRNFNLGSKLRHKDALSKWKLDYYTRLSYGFKVPLTLIYAPLQYLLKNYDQLTNTDVKRMLHTMSGNVFKLSEQVSKLMEFKKVSLGEYDVQLSKVDIIPVIQGICNLFLDEFATKHVTYSIEGNVTSVTTIIDITKIEVALYNIMEDAISYIIDNGRVEVKYMLDSHDYRLNVSIIASRSGEGESNVQELNTRFLIAYDYLKVHHSELSIRNIEGNRMREYIFDLLLGDSHYSAREMKTLDKAQSVSLLLPVTVQKDRTVDELNIDSDKTLPVIYLYEGDKDIDLFIKSVFQNKFNISLNTAATDIKHILDKIPSLVIFDVVKEDDYKFELCRKMKEYQILSAIPVIFISSLSSEITEQKAYEAGADVFIAKPFNVASLDARIRQLLDVRTAIKENIRKELIIDPKEVLITSDDDKFVANIINVIEDNIADVEFNIDKLASLLNISRSTLYRRAMEITNLSPSDLIRKRRMRRAAELLKQTSHPVSEICYMVGYSDQRYFGQSFKKEFGMTPKQYSIQKKV
nr:helix-turn-helix domain-containing protein [Bacteroides intestinalis]